MNEARSEGEAGRSTAQRPLRILYVGESDGTCRQRGETLRVLGHRVQYVDCDVPEQGWRRQLYRVGHRFRRPPDLGGTNRALVQAARAADAFDVLWIDKGLCIRPATLREVRRSSPSTALVFYSPDDMMNPDNQSRQFLGCLPLYDLYVTTKSYNVSEVQALGGREVLFIDNAYDPRTHRPVELSAAECARYAADVGFIGGYERDRAEAMLYLAEQGIHVVVWGYQWDRLHRHHECLTVHNEQLAGLEFAKCIRSTRINLNFLRKVNRDLQTTRSVEIPASGGFLLAERSNEHRRLFVEGEQAEFFESREEMLAKCRFYLEHEELRARIAAAGRQRCLAGGYSNDERLAAVLAHLGRSRSGRPRPRGAGGASTAHE